MITNILIVLHILAAVAIIVLVLLQQGRGADMGAAFGGGSQTLFGARGSANFLSRLTALIATVFLFTSLSLAFIYTQRSQPKSVTDETVEQPVAPVPADQDIPETPQSAPGGDGSDIPKSPSQPEAPVQKQSDAPEQARDGPAVPTVPK